MPPIRCVYEVDLDVFSTATVYFLMRIQFGKIILTFNILVPRGLLDTLTCIRRIGLFFYFLFFILFFFWGGGGYFFLNFDDFFSISKNEYPFGYFRILWILFC